MAGTITNNTEFHNTLDVLRICTSKRGKILRLKIEGGVKCDTVTSVKLTLISYLLVKYSDVELSCLESAIPGNTNRDYLETFVNYMTKECRDCIAAGESISNTSSNLPPTFPFNLLTQSGDILIDQSGDNIIHNG